MEQPMTCAACGAAITNIEDRGILWEGKPVHLVCGGPYDEAKAHPYHQHIFWNEAIPWGFYRFGEVSWEDIQAQAEAHGWKVSRDPNLGWGPFKDDEFIVLEFDCPMP